MQVSPQPGRQISKIADATPPFSWGFFPFDPSDVGGAGQDAGVHKVESSHDIRQVGGSQPLKLPYQLGLRARHFCKYPKPDFSCLFDGNSIVLDLFSILRCDMGY
jgi:hypothetical protein